MRSLFADLAEQGVKNSDAVFDALPPGFPEPLVTSVRKTIRQCTQWLCDALSDTAIG